MQTSAWLLFALIDEGLFQALQDFLPLGACFESSLSYTSLQLLFAILFVGHLTSSQGYWATFEWVCGCPGQWGVFFLNLCQSEALLSPVSATWPCSYESQSLKFLGWKQPESHCILLPVKPGLNLFFLTQNFYFYYSFWVTTCTVFAIQLVPLQEDSDDHSSGFYTFPHSIRFGSDDHLISSYLTKWNNVCLC